MGSAGEQQEGSGRQAEFRQSSSHSTCVENAQFDDGVGGEVFLLVLENLTSQVPSSVATPPHLPARCAAGLSFGLTSASSYISS